MRQPRASALKIRCARSCGHQTPEPAQGSWDGAAERGCSGIKASAPPRSTRSHLPRRIDAWLVILRREIVRQSAAPLIPTLRQIVRARRGSSSIRLAARSSGARRWFSKVITLTGALEAAAASAQERGQRPTHVGERRGPNRRSEKIRAPPGAAGRGSQSETAETSPYPTILGQIGSPSEPRAHHPH